MKIRVLSQDLLHLNMKNFDEKILKILICPKTGKGLLYDKKKEMLHTKDLNNSYNIKDNIVNFKSK